MTSQSYYNQTDRGMYNQQLSDYFMALNQAPKNEIKMSEADEQENEFLNELSLAGSQKLIDSGIHTAKDMVRAGIKKVGKTALDAGKKYAKQQIIQLGQKLNLPAETIEDLVEGRLDGVKTVNQALKYIQDKAQSEGSEAVAKVREVAGDITEKLKGVGEKVADESARARGVAEGALNQGDERINAVREQAGKYEFRPAEDEQARGFFNRMAQRFGGKRLTEGAGQNLVNQVPKNLEPEFTDPFTGEKVDLTAKHQLPDGWGNQNEDLGDMDGFTVADNQLQPKAISGFQRLVPQIGDAPPSIVQGERYKSPLDRDETQWQQEMKKWSQGARLDVDADADFSFQRPIQPSNIAKAGDIELDDLSNIKGVQQKVLKPGHRVLADALKNTTSEVDPSELPSIDELVRAGYKDTTFPSNEELHGRQPVFDDLDEFGDPSQLSLQQPRSLIQEAINEPLEPQRVVDEPPPVAPEPPKPEEDEPAFEPERPAPPEEEDEPKPEEEPPKPLPEEEEVEKAGAKAGEKVAEDTGETLLKGLGKGAEEIAETGGAEDPLGDAIGVGLALASIFGGVFGKKHATESAPPMPNFSNPSVPIGI